MSSKILIIFYESDKIMIKLAIQLKNARNILNKMYEKRYVLFKLRREIGDDMRNLIIALIIGLVVGVVVPAEASLTLAFLGVVCVGLSLSKIRK
jgi:hypothetical protein